MSARPSDVTSAAATRTLPRTTASNATNVLVGAPVASVLVGSVTPSGLPLDRGWTLAHYREIWLSPYTWRLIGNTIVFAGGATLLSVLLGGALAFDLLLAVAVIALWRDRRRGKQPGPG